MHHLWPDACVLLCREQFFEAARIAAQKDFQKNPKDAQVCVQSCVVCSCVCTRPVALVL
jgi:hypothetical protein